MIRPADFMGAWSLISATRYVEGRTEPDFPYGKKPRGLIIYSPDGYMTTQLHKDPEIESGVQQLFSYGGPWTLDGDLIRHDVVFATHPEYRGRTLDRRVSFQGEHLVLSPVKTREAIGVTWMDVVWKRPEKR